MTDILSTLSNWLMWDRAALEHGQLWRLVSASFVHMSWGHALANAIGLVLWWRLEGLANLPLRARSRIAAFFMGSVLVHVALYAVTRYDWYAGASATLYGLFAFTALRCGWRGGVMLGALVAWLTLGPQVVDYTFPVAVHAHWVGLSLGIAAGVLFWVRLRRWPLMGLPT